MKDLQLDAFINADEAKLNDLLQIDILQSRLGSFLDTLPLMMNEYNLDSTDWVTPEQLKAIEQDHTNVTIRGLESPERFTVLRQLLENISADRELIKMYEFSVNLDKQGLRVKEKYSPRRELLVPFDRLGNVNSFVAVLEQELPPPPPKTREEAIATLPNSI